MLDKISHFIATLGFAGYFPYAPGTLGSAMSLLLVLLLSPDDFLLITITLPLIVIGTIASHRTEKVIGKDSGHIIIDEFCGYLISVLFVPKGIGFLIAAFFLFRLFDIAKPPPVRNAERSVAGGTGIMLDDLLAGVYTNICLQVWIYFR